LEIDLDCAHPDVTGLTILSISDTTSESLLHKRELILFAEVTYITRLAKESDQDIGVPFSLFARTRMIVEERDAFAFVFVPQGAQGKHIGRRDFFIAKQCAQQLLAKFLRL
jgi:hypothetical protein